MPKELKTSEQSTSNGTSMVERDEKGRIVKGVLNPYGNKGSKNFDTIFREAIIKLAKTDDEFKKVVGKDIDEIDRKLVKKAIIEAMKGNLGYHKDIYDRRGLKPTEELDVNIVKKIISIDE